MAGERKSICNVADLADDAGRYIFLVEESLNSNPAYILSNVKEQVSDSNTQTTSQPSYSAADKEGKIWLQENLKGSYGGVDG